MDRTNFSLLCVVLLVACGGPAQPPNVLIVSIDTLSHGGLRAEASSSPGVAGLAERAVRFERALSTAPWTLPAQASLLTGVYPDRHGATDPLATIVPSLPTLAELLSARGYDTAAFTGGGYLSRQFGLARGFGRHDSRTRKPTVSTLPRSGAPPEIAGEDLFARARAWLGERTPRDGPFLLFLHTFSVRDYYLQPPWTAERAAQLAPSVGSDPDLHRACLRGQRSDCPGPVWRWLRALYEAEVTHVVSGLGDLLDVLDSQGLTESTYVWIVSDHGEGLEPERGRIHHGGRLHEDVIRIPFWVAGPGLVGREVRTPVSLVDVAPTVLEWTGLSPVEQPEHFEGRSLAGLLARGESLGEVRKLFVADHTYAYRDGRRTRSPRVERHPRLSAVIRGRDWYIVDHEEQREEFYDMALDPQQARDLAAAPPPRVTALQQALRERLRQPRPETPLRGGNDALRDRLRSLGDID